MYLKSFKTVNYPFFDSATGQFDTISVTDLTEFLKPSAQLVLGYATFYPYVIKDGERPDTVAQNEYGSPQYDWVIRLVNQIEDDQYDWPMNSYELLQYVTQKYGQPAMYQTHHYTDPTGQFIVDSSYPGAIGVSNLQYETDNNNNKRNIFLVQPQYLPMMKSSLSLLSQ